MEQKKHIIELGDVPLLFQFRFRNSAKWFEGYFSSVSDSRCSVGFSNEDIRFIEKQGILFCEDSEASLLAGPASEALLDYSRCLIHAVAFRFHDKAYLIVAPSGVGKSTQINMLRKLYPGEFSVICGDRPVLSFDEDEVIVHPSPWNGKEGWQGAESAPLAGIICLERGDINYIERMSVRDAVIPLFSAMIHTGKNENIVCRIAEFTSKILRSAPIWHLCSCSVPDSTLLLYEELSKQEV